MCQREIAIKDFRKILSWCRLGRYLLYNHNLVLYGPPRHKSVYSTRRSHLSKLLQRDEKRVPLQLREMIPELHCIYSNTNKLSAASEENHEEFLDFHEKIQIRIIAFNCKRSSLFRTFNSVELSSFVFFLVAAIPNIITRTTQPPKLKPTKKAIHYH